MMSPFDLIPHDCYGRIKDNHDTGDGFCFSYGAGITPYENDYSIKRGLTTYYYIQDRMEKFIIKFIYDESV